MNHRNGKTAVTKLKHFCENFHITYERSNLIKSTVSLLIPSIFKLNRNEHKLPRNKGDTGDDVVWFIRSASKSSATNGYKFEKILEPILCMKSQSFKADINSGRVTIEF